MRAIKVCLTIISSTISLICVCGQIRVKADFPEKSVDHTKELYRIITDRSAYIAGEEIRFRIFNHDMEYLNEIEWSKVYYLELISPGGLSYARAKLPLDSGGTSGTIHIPDDLSSGNYYLKGYTRWMRNDGPATYSYLSVEIVNPDIKSVLPVDTSSEYSISFQKQDFTPGKKPSVAYKMSSELKLRSPAKLLFNTDKCGGKIDCCISVVPVGSFHKQSEYNAESVRIRRVLFDQLPETRGISLAGKVDFADSDMPATFAVVYVTRMGNGKEFYCNYTDSAGRFHFAFPEQHGEQDLFISADHRTTDRLKVSIDLDFCNKSISLPSFPLHVDQKRLNLFAQMADNLKIRNQYYPSQSTVEEEVSLPEGYFYSTPVLVVEFDDFIRLPTMSEYFSEVIPQVSLRKSEKGMRLRVQGDHPDLGVFAPLLMIDGVAIADIESVLAVSPRLIERIEIVDAPFIRGNITFGGIINIISRNDDLALIDLPESGLLLHYQMYDQHVPYPPDPVPAEVHLPDVRNTLFWSPQVELTPGTDTVISFNTSDSSGEYVVLLRGYDSQGSYFEQGIPFTLE